MKSLIVGGGSMGKRRVRCLLAHDVPADAIRVVDVREDRRDEVRQRYGVAAAPTLMDGMRWGPDVVLVCVPPSEHLDICLTAARAGKPFFCEVPLALGLEGTDELSRFIRQKGVLAMPGIQVPFHPLIKRIKQWLEDPAFGRLLAINQEWGQYLPDWHPYEDYRGFYAAKQSMGGAAIDILGHEVAMHYWLKEDRIRRLCCAGDHLSSLEIDGNDYWQILAETDGGVRMVLQYDLIQRAVHNTCRWVSEQGVVEIEIGGSVSERARARRFLVSTGAWEEVSPPDDYEYEQAYIDEIGRLIDCVRGASTWHVPWETALDVVRFIEASLASDREGTWVDLS